jgi:hypothetical protein
VSMHSHVSLLSIGGLGARRPLKICNAQYDQQANDALP